MVISINAMLGVVVLAANSRRLQNRLFALLCLSFVVWVSSAFMAAVTHEYGKALFWARFSFFGVGFVAPLYLHFILSFESRVVPLHIYLPAFVFSGLSFFSDLLVIGLHRSAGNFMYVAGSFDDIVYGIAFPFFALYFISSILYGLCRSFTMLRRLRGFDLFRMRLLVFGTALPVLIGSITNIVLPLFGIYGYGIAEYLTVIMAVFFFYAFFEARPTE